MLSIKELLELELFRQLPESRLTWICDRAAEINLKKGDILVEEGDPHRGFMILLAGTMDVTRLSEGIQMPIGKHQAPAFFGEIQILSDDSVPVTVQALADCRLYEIDPEDFLVTLHECRDFERIIFKTMQKRLRGLESLLKDGFKLERMVMIFSSIIV